jgi:hypothetical protein
MPFYNINRTLDKPEVLNELKRKAYEYGRNITWPKTGEKYVSLVQNIFKGKASSNCKERNYSGLLNFTTIFLAHINRLTDDTGIIQHAKFGIPNLKEGYCLDDNARALLMALMAYRQMKDVRALELSPIYFSYIHYMQNRMAPFSNFLSFSRKFLDEVGSEDSFGSTIWALGYLLGNAPNDAYYQTGKLIFFNASPNFEGLKSIRSIANTMIGISYYLKSNPSDDTMTERLRRLSKYIN